MTTRGLRTFPRGMNLRSGAFRDQLNDIVHASNTARGQYTGQGASDFRGLSTSKMFLFTQFGPNDLTDRDFIVGVELFEDGSSFGLTNIKIAMPFLLRRTPFDAGSRAGISYTYTNNFTRSADDGGGPVEEIIVPSFEVGDVIFAHNAFPHTRVHTDASDPGSPWITLQMENDGRMWSRDVSTSGGT